MAKKGKKAKKVAKVGVKKEKGYLYYLRRSPENCPRTGV